MRYRIIRLWSGFSFEDLTNEKSQIIHDGTIITYYDPNPITAMFGRMGLLKVSERTTDKQLIDAIENEATHEA